MDNSNEDKKELLATARAIYFAYQHRAISRKQAKERSKPILRCLNTTVATIAKKHNLKPKYITFQDLGKHL